MRRLLLAALAGAAFTVPVLADEGSGTGRANYYLELAAEQERLRAGRATGALRAESENRDAFTRSPARERRPARPRR